MSDPQVAQHDLVIIILIIIVNILYSAIDFNCPSSLWARENDGTMRLRLRRSWDQRHGPIDVTINTVDDEAVAGEDYDAITADVVTIDSGQLTHDVIIDIIDDVVSNSYLFNSSLYFEQ